MHFSLFSAARTRALVITCAFAATSALVVGTAPATASTPAELAPVAPSPAVAPDARVSVPASVLHADDDVPVFVQVSGMGALSVQQDHVLGGASLDSAESEASRVAERNESVAGDVAAQITRADPDAEVLYTTAYTVPGVAITTDAAALNEIAGRDDVVKISPIVLRTLELPSGADEPRNAASDVLTRAVDAWQQTGRTGQDVTVAVIDTGLDYTHATFGGPGTPEAYQTALASQQAPNPSWFDSAKYLGGWDFAGTTYNGSQGTNAYDPVPRPDANPIDGPGGNHGTHVAGTAVGYGVTDDGTTFRGDYTQLAAESVADEFPVGPGSAPEAGLLALKIFGDRGGSTALTGAALDWIAEQIASGTRIDVVNMSLGTDRGAVDDPDNAKVEALMDAGVLPVIAAGNAGDITDISGSPGNTDRALTVAASASGSGLGDAAYAYIGDPAVVTPQQVRGQYSQNYAGSYSTTATVAAAPAANANGCQPFSPAETASIADRIVWLEWDDDAIVCGSGVRFDNAADAGAVGVVLESQSNAFEAGIAGNSDIPGIQLTADAVASLRPALEAGTLVLRLDSEGRATIAYADATRTDTIASFTSRGVHGSFGGTLKPDVAAPGVTVVSAANGTGNGAASMSGTSMATPHVAGLAALVAEAHPDWSPDRIKQQIVNTAAHDVTTGGDEPRAYGPARVGTGRVDALAAIESEISVRSVENGDAVSASFGVIEVGDAPVIQTRTLELHNDGAVDRDVTLRYLPRTETPGVTYQLSADSAVVPAGGSTTVTLTLRIDDAGMLRRTLDPTMQAMLGGAPRQFITDASGVLEVAGGAGRPTVRLAVFSAPKPVSATTVDAVAFDGTAGRLDVSGRGLDQGEGSERYRSLLVPLVLGTTDADDTFPDDSAQRTLNSIDILAVGASSDAPLQDDPSQGVLTFGIVTDDDWASMSPLAYPTVQLDVNADGRSDFLLVVQPAAGMDTPMVLTVDTVTGETVDQRPVNGVYGDQGTNLFDTNVATLSTSLAALGYTPGTTQTQVRYIVQTRSYYNPGYDDTYRGTLVDQTSPVSFDVYAPPMVFGSTGGVLFADTAGSLPVTRQADAASQVLVLHLHGAEGARSQIVTPTVAASPAPAPDPSDPAPTAAPSAPPVSGHDDDTTPGRDGSLARTGQDASMWVLLAAGALLVTGLGIAMRVRRHRSVVELEEHPDV